MGEANAALPQHLPLGHVASRTRVVAELDARGAPTAVSAVQRLTIRGTGDYFFAIPAPVRDALPGPGTQSKPGLRPGMVLWQGFSGGGRILSAQLVFEPAQVAKLLPIRLKLSRSGSLVTLELDNATAVRVSSFTAVAAPSDVHRYLAALARFAAGGPVPYPYLNANGVRRVRRTIVAPLGVTGALMFPSGRRVRLDLTLGAQPRTLRVTTSAKGLPRLALVVRPVPLEREAQARPTFDAVMEASLRLARTRQYEAFVANPDAAGPTSSSYVFRSALRRNARPAARGHRGNDSPLFQGLIVGALALVLAAGVVAWAHS